MPQPVALLKMLDLLEYVPAAPTVTSSLIGKDDNPEDFESELQPIVRQSEFRLAKPTVMEVCALP